MKKRYISFDVEATGPTPGKHSMISVGACVVGNLRGKEAPKFYRELKPISLHSDRGAMKIGCLGLKCLEQFSDDPELNPKSKRFNKGRALEVLADFGTEPRQAMIEYAAWVREHSYGHKAVQAAAPISFDAMFTNWYFDNFAIQNPFGHTAEDINSMYRGVMNDPNAHIAELGIRRGNGLPHHALKDAIIQGKEMEKVLKLMGIDPSTMEPIKELA